MQSPIKFELKVTVGNLITIAILCVGGITGYIRLENKVEMVISEFIEHKVAQAEESKAYVRKDVQETRNQFIDRQLERIQNQLNDILIEIKRIQ